jgi:release factor glutamine methyltransferase
MSVQVQDLLATTFERLSAVSETPVLDAQVLLAHVLGKPRTWLLAHPEVNPDASETIRLESLMRRLEGGEVLPYLLGHQEFFGLDFDVTPDVLIPRPETELLVESAVAWLGAKPDRRTVADIGTGCGCIAICLAHSISDVRVLATEISRPALRVAAANSRKHRVSERIDLLQCDLLPSCAEGLPTDRYFDLVCANLPYIPTATLIKLPIYGKEPALALDGGPDGLDPFRRLFGHIPEWMTRDGLILLEIESSSGAAVLSLAYDAFHAASIHLHQDLAGHDRLLEIQLAGT